ncbi:MAG: phosphatase PAP2 family protein [Bacteroidales bacterium]|nr:phosphatase PAP2 family protein [Bacteroidales bacterium]MBQ7819753.1 phosphatase PAP2 family protein [Bacteroidales bacterium]
MRKSFINILIVVLLLFGVDSYASKSFTIYSLPQMAEDDYKLEEFTLKLYEQTKFDKLTSSKLFEIAGIGVPITIAGIIVKQEDNRFSNYNKVLERSHFCSFDDYTQYVPLVAKYLMKVSGVKGRSSWGRMITSDILSVALMTGSVELLKHTMDMPRPDGEDNHSFPSGHTAVAFMGATLLNKEYGHISPWIPIASYTVASATAIGRQLNSAHWLSDIVTGAGIGILSAELGYYFADLIFRDKGLLNKPEIPKWEYGRCPSRFSTIAGVSTVLGSYSTIGGESVDVKVGTRVGFEGAYFPHKNVGVGVGITMSNNMLAVEERILDGFMTNLSLQAGVYYDCQLSGRWSVGGKTLTGYSFYSGKASWSEYGLPEQDGSYSFTAGVSVGFLAYENMRFSALCDYNFLAKSRVQSNKSQHEIFAGLTTSVMF